MRDIEQIDWTKVLLADELREPASFLKRLIALILGIVSFFFRRSVPTVYTEPGVLLCVKSMERGDYEEQWCKTLDCIELKKQVVTVELRRGLSLDPFKRLRGLLPAWQASKHKEGLIQRLSATLFAMYCLDVVHSFRHATPSQVLFFAEMRPLENVLVQFYNSRCVPTVTLQHGLFINYGDQKTVNRLNYEASCAQTFLAWGKETAELIKRYNPNVEIVICGALQIEEPETESGQPCIYVVFDADINVEQNRQLLAVAKQLAESIHYEVVVCLHPRNARKLYALTGVSLLPKGDDYRRNGIVLGHTTTQIIKLARFGKKVFKLRSHKPCNQMIPDAVQFNTCEELLPMVQRGAYPNGWAQAHIAYIGIDAVMQYKLFFEKA